MRLIQDGMRCMQQAIDGKIKSSNTLLQTPVSAKDIPIPSYPSNQSTQQTASNRKYRKNAILQMVDNFIASYINRLFVENTSKNSKKSMISQGYGKKLPRQNRTYLWWTSFGSDSPRNWDPTNHGWPQENRCCEWIPSESMEHKEEIQVGKKKHLHCLRCIFHFFSKSQRADVFSIKLLWGHQPPANRQNPAAEPSPFLKVWSVRILHGTERVAMTYTFPQ